MGLSPPSSPSRRTRQARAESALFSRGPRTRSLPGVPGETGFNLHAGGTDYVLTVFTVNPTGTPQANPNTIAVTMAGVDSSDVAADNNTNASVTVPASGSIQVTTAAGYVPFADVGANLANLPACTFRLFANCGVGSVEAQCATGQSGAGSNLRNVVIREQKLPVATQYRLTVEFTNPNGATATCNASLSTYEVAGGGGGGGAVVLSPEVTGPSNANVVSGPFSTASLAWKANVVAPTWTQLIAAMGAGAVMSYEAQAAAVGSGLGGGALNLTGGLGDGAGVNGNVNFAWGSPATIRGFVDSAHGIIVAGNGGTDWYAAMGPLTGNEATNSAFWLLPNAAARSASNPVMYADATNTVVNTPGGAGAIKFYQAGATFLGEWDNTAFYLKTTPVFEFAATLAAPTIKQENAAGATVALTIQAQTSGGGVNDGGSLVLSGGAPSGAAAAGSVHVTTPFNAGFLSRAVVAGANALSVPESNNNLFIFTGALAGGATVTMQRDITDTSLVFVRNATNQTVTVSCLTGGTVNVLTNTAALIASDGANLQTLMTGT